MGGVWQPTWLPGGQAPTYLHSTSTSLGCPRFCPGFPPSIAPTACPPRYVGRGGALRKLHKFTPALGLLRNSDSFYRPSFHFGCYFSQSSTSSQLSKFPIPSGPPTSSDCNLCSACFCPLPSQHSWPALFLTPDPFFFSLIFLPQTKQNPPAEGSKLVAIPPCELRTRLWTTAVTDLPHIFLHRRAVTDTQDPNPFF